MPDGMRDTTPTRTAVFELEEEHQVVREGYDFLDEKRLLLAAEILLQLKHYQELMDEFEGLHHHAAVALADAATQHGLQGLEVYPAVTLVGARVEAATQSFLGVTLVQIKLACPSSEPAMRAVNPSPEVEYCREQFRQLIERAAVIAGISSNLFRLMAEYRRTERRARALENVILPEIEEILGEMRVGLEEIDQEETVRTRLHYNSVKRL